jgi:hypothetical protein
VRDAELSLDEAVGELAQHRAQPEEQSESPRTSRLNGHRQQRPVPLEPGKQDRCEDGAREHDQGTAPRLVVAEDPPATKASPAINGVLETAQEIESQNGRVKHKRAEQRQE